MAETNVFERTFERPVDGIHQNTSYSIFCITTRPKLLINDCVKINEGTAIVLSYFSLFVGGIPLCSHFKTLQC